MHNPVQPWKLNFGGWKLKHNYVTSSGDNYIPKLLCLQNGGEELTLTGVGTSLEGLRTCSLLKNFEDAMNMPHFRPNDRSHNVTPVSFSYLHRNRFINNVDNQVEHNKLGKHHIILDSEKNIPASKAMTGGSFRPSSCKIVQG